MRLPRRGYSAVRRGKRLANSSLLSALILAAIALAVSAQAEEHAPKPKKPTITLPSLTAQGFEVKAAFGSYIVLQKGKDVWLCYMLETRSSCDPAE